ncbi:MAG: hypothetical protein KAY54_10885, partial [Burkholderiaceae bacterium]|nr:hypothetical protein [Burkholderiaceae bacterium]
MYTVFRRESLLSSGLPACGASRIRVGRCAYPVGYPGLAGLSDELHYVRLLGGANLAAQRLAFTEQKMSTHRVYKSHEFMQPAEKEP